MSIEPEKSLTSQDAYSFKTRAESAKNKRQGVIVVRFRGVPMLVDDSKAGAERIVVQPKTRTYQIIPGVSEPRLLAPGAYPIGRIATAKSQTGSLKDARLAGRVTVLCTVSDLPLPCTIALPDLDLISSAGDDTSLLNNLSLRTSDNVLGGAQLQLSLICDDPVRLLKAFGQDHFEAGEVRKDQTDSPDASAAGPPQLGVFARLSKYLFGDEPEEFLVDLPHFTIQDLYWRINLELTTSIRASVRRFTARQLYDEIEHRTEVERDIQRDMEVTLANYGMRIDRVSAFQFSSPDYERLLEERAKVALDNQRLDDFRAAAQVEDQKRDILGDQFRKEASEQADRDRHQTVENAKTKDLQDQIAQQELRRTLERDLQQKTHDRDQRAEDERLKMDLMFEKARRAMELQNEAAALQWQRQQQMLEFYKDVPADRLLQLAMIQNPLLANTFVAVQQAQDMKDRIALQQKFQEEIVKVYGQNRDQVQQLLVEAARQLGSVMTAKVAGPGQQPLLRSSQPPEDEPRTPGRNDG